MKRVAVLLVLAFALLSETAWADDAGELNVTVTKVHAIELLTGTGYTVEPEVIEHLRANPRHKATNPDSGHLIWSTNGSRQDGVTINYFRTQAKWRVNAKAQLRVDQQNRVATWLTSDDEQDRQVDLDGVSVTLNKNLQIAKIVIADVELVGEPARQLTVQLGFACALLKDEAGHGELLVNAMRYGPRGGLQPQIVINQLARITPANTFDDKVLFSTMTPHIVPGESRPTIRYMVLSRTDEGPTPAVVWKQLLSPQVQELDGVQRKSGARDNTGGKQVTIHLTFPATEPT